MHELKIGQVYNAPNEKIDYTVLGVGKTKAFIGFNSLSGYVETSHSISGMKSWKLVVPRKKIYVFIYTSKDGYKTYSWSSDDRNHIENIRNERLGYSDKSSISEIREIEFEAKQVVSDDE